VIGLLIKLRVGEGVMTGIPVGMLVVDNSVRELQTQDIVLVESVSLQSVYDKRSLQSCFEIGKTEDYFLTWFFLSWDQTDSFKTDEGPEDVSYLSFGSIDWNPFYVHGVRGILGDGHNRLLIKLRLERASELR
jgi:hypothetical protein